MICHSIHTHKEKKRHKITAKAQQNRKTKQKNIDRQNQTEKIEWWQRKERDDEGQRLWLRWQSGCFWLKRSAVRILYSTKFILKIFTVNWWKGKEAGIGTLKNKRERDTRQDDGAVSINAKMRTLWWRTHIRLSDFASRSTSHKILQSH